MTKKTLSIVIPVFDEEGFLADCLDAIKSQSVMPDEVIVVDNNSTDKSAEIAKSYDFVTLLKENQQGIVFARNRGFDKASSALIGRIDADTVLPKDWVESVKEYMNRHPDRLAVNGPCTFGSIPVVSTILFGLHRIVYFWSSRLLFGHNILFGSNTIITKNAWDQVSKDICLRTDIHEDMDLAHHLESTGIKVHFEPTIVARISGRRWVSSQGLFVYPRMWLKTRLVHSSLAFRNRDNK